MNNDQIKLMYKIDSKIKNRILEEMEKKSISNVYIACSWGVSRQSITNIFGKPLSIKTIVKFCDTLNIDIKELFVL